tara:strand:+ start:9260 stop:15376 length:6117 start_codon:yes stop_codon:yes gene_type:complete
MVFNKKLLFVFLFAILLVGTISASGWGNDLNEGLFAYYKFDNLSADGLTAIESLTGTYNTAGFLSANWTDDSFLTKSYKTDGNGKNLGFSSIDMNIGDNNNEMSIAFWFKRVKTDANTKFFNTESGATAGGFACQYNGATSFECYANGVGPSFCTFGTSIGTRYHVVLQMNTTTAWCVVNNVVDNNLLDLATAWDEMSVDFFIMATNGGAGQQRNQLWDELGFWNRTLSPAQISDLYGGGSGISYELPDVTNPTVSIVYPTNTSYVVNVTALNYIASDDTELDSCWYSFDNGATNSTPQTCNTNWTGLSSTQGSNTWTVYVNDTSGNEASDNVTFYKDTVAPTVTSQSPSNATHTNTPRNYTVDVSDTGGLINATLFLYNSSGDLYYSENNNFVGEPTNFELGIVYNISVEDEYIWFYSATDKYNQVGYSENRTIVQDGTHPVLTWYAPQGTPLVSSSPYQMNVSVYDPYLDATNVTVYNATGEIIYTNFTGNLTVDTFWQTDLITLNEGDNVLEMCARDSLEGSPKIKDKAKPEKESEKKTKFKYKDKKDKQKNITVDRTVKVKEDKGGKEVDTETLNLETIDEWIDEKHYKTTWTIDALDKGKDKYFEIVLQSPDTKLVLLTDRGVTRVVDEGRNYYWRFDDMEQAGFDVNYQQIGDTVVLKVKKGTYIEKDGKWILDPIFAGLNTICQNESLELDTTSPVVDVVYPVESAWYDTDTLDLDYTYTELNCDSAWYSLDAGVTNSSPASCGQNWTSLTASEGSNTWTVYMNDTLGHESSDSNTFNVDLTYPIIAIDYPAESGLYDYDVEDFNYTYVETNCDVTWYSVDGGATNSSTNSCGDNFTNVSSATGSNTWIIYIKDLAGNENTTTVTFTQDTTPPVAEGGGGGGSGTSPANDSYTKVDDTNFTINASDDVGIENVTFFVLNETDNIINQTTIEGYSATEIFFGFFYTLYEETVYKWFFRVVDVVGNVFDTSTYQMTYDITEPEGAILYPLNTSYNQTITAMNFSIVETNPHNCWYSTDLGVTNNSVTCGNNVTGLSSSEGSNTWMFWVNDSVAFINKSSVTFITDTTAPTISIISPVDATYYALTELFVNISTSDADVGVDTVWFFNGLTNVTYTSAMNYSFPEDNITMIAYVNDTLNYVNSTSINFIVDITYPAVSVNLTNPNQSTDSLPITLNFTYSISDTNIDECWYQLDEEGRTFGWESDNFNNSLENENLTFTGSENFTRYLSVPLNNSIANANAVLSGYLVEESVSQNAGGISSVLRLNLKDRAGTKRDATLMNNVHIKNVSFKIGKQGSPDLDVYFRVRNLSDTIIQEVNWGSATALTGTTPNQNWESVEFTNPPLINEEVRVLLEYYGDTLGTNGVYYLNLHSDISANEVYTDYLSSYTDDANKEMVYKLELFRYPIDAWLEVGTPDGNYEWNYTGELNVTGETTVNFSSAINTALNGGACDCSGCSIDGDNCLIPFTFHSDNEGIVEYSDLEFSTSAEGDLLNCSGSSDSVEVSSDGYHNLTVYAVDLSNQTTSNRNPFYIFHHTPSQSSSVNTTTEGAVIDFNLTINMTDLYDAEAYLVYDGIDYLADTSQAGVSSYSFEKELTIPDGSGNSTGRNVIWYWKYTIEGNSYWEENYTAENQSQIVYSVEIDDCSAYPNIIFHYDLNDEGTDTTMNLTNRTTNIEAEVQIISLGDPELYWEYNKTFTTVSGSICIPDGILNYSDYRMDTVLGYETDDYVQEFWYLDNGNLSLDTYALDNWTDRNITIRELLLDDSSTFLFKYYDENYLIHREAVVILYRKFIGEGIFKEAERCQLDNNGECHFHLVEEDVIYKFLVTDAGAFEFESGEYNAKCIETPCRITLQKGAEGGQWDTEFDALPEGTYDLNSDSGNRTVTLTFNLEDTGTMELDVYTYSNVINSPDTLVASDSVVAKTGEIEVIIPLSYGNQTYYAVARHNDGFVTSVWVDMNESGFQYFGTLGLFLGALLVLTLGLIAISSGGWTIAFLILGLLIASITKLIDMDFYLIMWVVSAGGLIVWKLSTRRSI